MTIAASTNMLFDTRPKRPEPINLAVREVIPWDEFDFRWNRSTNSREFAQRVKRGMVQKIAEELMKHCEPFVVEEFSERGKAYQIEVVLSDRGTYEHWLPAERSEGAREGYARAVKVMTDSLPYGMADAATEFYD